MDTQQLEAFALAKDRSRVLESLIPGTEDHFFHACLVQEQAGNLDEVQALLDRWNKIHGETALFREIRNRLQLLRYKTKPKETLEYLRYQLGLQFNHERIAEGSAAAYPSRLDETALSREAIRRQGLSYSNSSDLSGFTDAAIEWLAEEPLDGQRLRALLERLSRPDIARLPELVAAELKDTRNTGGFGAIPIHGQMLEEQLVALLKLVPSLRDDDNYVSARLVKLQPGPDVDWRNESAERKAFLERLWNFVKDLAPKFNSLKAHILYHRLDHDRRSGVMDKARFTEYLKLPRQVTYANPDWLKRFKRDEEPFELGQDFSSMTLQAAVANDEELVRDYLAHFFVGAKDWKPFETWLHTDMLKEVFASTKMLSGEGDKTTWYAMINNPAFCQALNDRVEILFAKTNRSWFSATEAVTLEVDVKNVPSLTVKVFEINNLNFFLANGRDVDTGMDLDGLVAGEEQSYRYDEAPIRRVRRNFDFQKLVAEGVYIVEFIGGGISSRVLVRKGRLRFLERVGSAGHVFTVLDEDGTAVSDASIWLGGREYIAQDEGGIRIPFSARPGRESFLLRHGKLTTLEQFDHQGENYRLFAGLYVDRESLIKKKEAQLVLRPSLQVNGIPASLSLLEEPCLLMESTDREGTSSSREIRDFAVSEDQESIHTFLVPEGLAALSFTFRGKVQNLSLNQKTELSDTMAVALNGIDAECCIEDLHLARTSAGYLVLHAGKSGEAQPGTALNVQLEHRDLDSSLDTTLQTDADGLIQLGHLRDITTLTVSTQGGVSETWNLPRDRSRLASAIHVRAGEAFRVPFMDVAALGGIGVPDENGSPSVPEKSIRRSDASLLELVAGTFVRDHFNSLGRKNGYLEVAGLKSGDYQLFLKRDDIMITIRVAAGEDRAGWIVAGKRHLERGNPRPLQIADVALNKTQLRISVGNSNGQTRVHVFGTRFVPAYSSFESFARSPAAGVRATETSRALSYYVSGRDIGDEYRYILERKQSAKFAGNMLARPGLLLNPWAVRSTETATQEAAAGGAYAASPQPAMCESTLQEPAPVCGAEDAGQFSNLDFLANPSAVLVNLKPDAKGVVTIPQDAFKHANTLRIVALDHENTVCRDFLLAEVETAHEDLRLRLALDAGSHFCEKRQITILSANQALEIADITTSTTEVYDTLAKVFRLYATLSGNTELSRFNFILQWPRMGEEERRATYSEFACHELSFFIAQKDPDWFKRVVRPYVGNKMDKTFLDHWLLEDDLSGYRAPWAFSRLNIVERILLGRRFDDEGDVLARHARDLNDLLARDIERAQRLFGAAMAGSALEAGDSLGIATQAAEMQRSAMANMEMAMPVMMPAPKSSTRGASSVREMKKAKRAERDEFAEKECMEESDSAGDYEGPGGRLKNDAKDRAAMRQFYRTLDTTQEWAENNYWHLGIEQQGPDLITINPFWTDYAAWRGPGPFLSRNLAYASRNFSEIMFALSVLDLPFEAEKPQVNFEGARMRLTGKASSVAFHKEIENVEPSGVHVPILVSQNYFRDDDRSREENGELVDKYVSGEFLVNVVYTCQIVLTNPTSTNQKLDLLLQIPTGALPVRNGFYTKGSHLELAGYATQSVEYSFYFPVPGSFPHFPAHVAKNEELIAHAASTLVESQGLLVVVRELSRVDKDSWIWISQHGDHEAVLAWLEKNNADRVDLALIAWRLRDAEFCGKCLALLTGRHIYNDTLWSYAIHHNDLANIREYLLHQDGFLGQCGLVLESLPVSINPVERRSYQHLEYMPLVNARTGKLGSRRTILNNRFGEQYSRLMTVLRYRGTLSDADKVAVSYYLLLQERVDEALETFAEIDPAKIPGRLQCDYLEVYVQFCREKPEAARVIAQRYKDYPVDRWRNLFANALAQIDEISGTTTRVIDEKDRGQQHESLAASEPGFDFTIEKKVVTVTVQNLSAVTVNWYRMDIELLFSRQPFVQEQSGSFAFIQPNRSDVTSVPEGKNALSFDVPKEFHGANAIVEIIAAGKRKSMACYAHELQVSLIENYGLVRVAHAVSLKPLPKTYVKVYARMKGGEVKFYKDGYTDLRGVYDYTSLSTNELDNVERFAILVMSEESGAVIKEASVPRR